MGRKKRVIIVGLPSFANKVAKNLNRYCPSASFKSLDTYYSMKDKLLAIPYIFFADTVYSINGSLTRSKVFDLALKWNKKLVMHWVGTDVIKSTAAKAQGNYMEEYLTGANHLCEVEWIQNELKEIGIDASIQNFVAFDQDKNINRDLKEFTVLSYLYPGREKFYGIDSLIQCANQFPHIRFDIAGANSYEEITPENIRFLGWVNDLGERISKAGMCLRFPEHDGLSSFVLESLARGKFVAYKYNFPHCDHCPDLDSLLRSISKRKEEFERSGACVNEAGADFIEREFNEDKIFPELLHQLGVN